ncbi:hypothetical protein [Pseudomonas farsensis]|uniref:Uncharacterized protein n=2 Tax=Pseudomonas TaxID=286 RepID=A0ABU8QMI5_9PSED
MDDQYGGCIMVSHKNFYRPIEVAILWSGLADHEKEIVKQTLTRPDDLLKLFPHWPSLQTYSERIYDAIACHQLPATYLNRPITSDTEFEKAYLSIRHSDLRIWVECYYPDDKPIFLFGNETDHSHCISIGAHLALKAELEASDRELQKTRKNLENLHANSAQQRENPESPQPQTGTPGSYLEQSNSILYVIIGALLDVSIGKSDDGKVQSIYSTQTILVETVTNRFSNVQGLSKRTLDRKFAEARRHLAQAIRA